MLFIAAFPKYKAPFQTNWVHTPLLVAGIFHSFSFPSRFDLAESFCGVLPNMKILITERFYWGLHCPGVADPAMSSRG